MATKEAKREAERFLRHALVPFVAIGASNGWFGAGESAAVLEAGAIGGAYVGTLLWSKWNEKRNG